MKWTVVRIDQDGVVYPQWIGEGRSWFEARKAAAHCNAYYHHGVFKYQAMKQPEAERLFAQHGTAL